ncbi:MULTISPECIES: glycosyltransferase 87 family protein [Arthrobacter]|uniref:Glycosyltransferase 87 family protein n=2 Tax=Arthrobacter TaxID=1663 RepID=A0ABU9KHF6_9MICC|nr:glycosyltransferase 87 family protein [Arthrobacter sp. YJM1]MDP5225632.1 glycosyltransferase 87 family protein [Arthrobacter sp. YJM1]
MFSDAFFSSLTDLRNRIIPRRVQEWLCSRAGLWTGFAVLHGVFLVFALILATRNEAFSDTFIYRGWVAAGFNEQLISGPSPWVYPILALPPMAIAYVFGPALFFFMWVLMITVLNGVALGMLTAWGRKRESMTAAWWWLCFIFLMGWLGFARVDGFTAPIVLIALLYGVRRPFVASAILAVATWMKVWPAAVILALFTVVKDRVKVVLGGVAVTAVVGVCAALLGVLPKLMNFLTQQGDRGMQLEATFTTPWLWLSVLHVGDSHMYMNTDINSMQVDGPGTTVMSTLMQPLLLLAAAVVAALVFWALHQGKLRGGIDRTELLLAGTLALTVAFIVFNKVGSPQFMVWLAPAVALGLMHDFKAWRAPAVMLILIAVTTFLIYPLFYDALSHDNPWMALVLTVRNLLLVGLLVISVHRLYALGREAKASASALSAA